MDVWFWWLFSHQTKRTAPNALKPAGVKAASVVPLTCWRDVVHWIRLNAGIRVQMRYTQTHPRVNMSTAFFHFLAISQFIRYEKWNCCCLFQRQSLWTPAASVRPFMFLTWREDAERPRTPRHGWALSYRSLWYLPHGEDEEDKQKGLQKALLQRVCVWRGGLFMWDGPLLPERLTDTTASIASTSAAELLTNVSQWVCIVLPMQTHGYISCLSPLNPCFRGTLNTPSHRVIKQHKMYGHRQQVKLRHSANWRGHTSLFVWSLEIIWFCQEGSW